MQKSSSFDKNDQTVLKIFNLKVGLNNSVIISISSLGYNIEWATMAWPVASCKLQLYYSSLFTHNV